MSESETLLNILLQGRSDTFKAKVLDIVYRHHLDPNDPNFQILIATGQLEILLQEAPEQFEATLSQLLETLRRLVDSEVKTLQRLIQTEREVLQESLLGAKQLTEEHNHTFEQKIQDIHTLIASHQSAQKTWIETQQAHQKAEHEHQRDITLQEYKAALAKEAKGLIQLAALELRGSWAIRVALPSAIAFLSIASIGFLGGWSTRSAQIYQYYSPAELEFLAQLWRENRDRMLKCRTAKQSECVIRLVSLGQKSSN